MKRKKKYYLYLTAEERSEILQSLIEKKNQLIRNGRYTDAIDELFYKIARGKIKRLKVKNE